MTQEEKFPSGLAEELANRGEAMTKAFADGEMSADEYMERVRTIDGDIRDRGKSKEADATPAKPERFWVLATERRKEFNASIFALSRWGKPERNPAEFVVFESEILARQWLDEVMGLDHAAWTYTVFQMQ